MPEFRKEPVEKVKERLLDDMVSFGQSSHLHSSPVGEDYSFCRKAAKLGFKSYVDCGVAVSHVGVHEYDFRHSMIHAKPQEPQVPQELVKA